MKKLSWLFVLMVTVSSLTGCSTIPSDPEEDQCYQSCESKDMRFWEYKDHECTCIPRREPIVRESFR